MAHVLICTTHRRIAAGLTDLHSRGVISAADLAVASQCNHNECGYLIKEQDAHGACVIRHP